MAQCIVMEAKVIFDMVVLKVGFVDIVLGPVDVDVENFVASVFIKEPNSIT